jgi:acyl-CoA reductase-like NAD-dependent aldehyde dehydrogenase
MPVRVDSDHADESVGPFFDGKLSRSESEFAVNVINPSNGRCLLAIPAGCDADVDHAVNSARKAFEDGRWSGVPPSFRTKALRRLADLIAREGGALDVLDACEMGKPVSTGAFNAAAAADLMRFNAESGDKMLGDVYTSDEHSFVAQRRVPRGVVAAVVPWNFPTFNAVLKIAPALATGNCVVLKPSELSSRSAMRIAKLALEAGVPEGVFNVVPGLGETVGRALGLHMDVDMVAFTGSTDVGKMMLQYAGLSNMKVVMAECGGKSPQIVFADGVDLGAASEAIVSFLLTNQGQVCSVGSRLIVHRSIEDLMLKKITTLMKDVVMGDAVDPQTTFGPLVSEKQCNRVMGYIQNAQADGTELVCGGRRMLMESGGFFVEPTVFRNVPLTSRLAQEEIFGPVLSVTSFEDEAEAIRIANSTQYGLAAYVWTASLSTGMRMARRIHSLVVVNAVSQMGEGAGDAVSWEPARQSGVGIEGGLAGLESYTRRQLTWFNHA